MSAQVYDCLVLGGGQAGLATGYYLRRKGLNFAILDAESRPGGAWLHTWPSLTLFSTTSASNLPGWPMPFYEGFPPASHVVDYLSRYEERYELPVRRPFMVESVEHDGEFFHVYSSTERLMARTVVAATGTWRAPFIPYYPGKFAGTQWHSAIYPGVAEFSGSRVAVVGAANSGAQIAADLLLEGISTTWLTRGEPRWMPDDVDGRVLFRRNRERLNAINRGEPDPGADTNLCDIVMVPPVLKARDEGLLRATPMPNSLDDINADHLIWATGFRPALRPISRLLVDRQPTVPGLFLVGFGTWTGPGSATITGVSPFAKQAAADVASFIKGRID